MPAPPGVARTTGTARSVDFSGIGSPNRDQSARDAIDDLGLVCDDRTEDLRPNTRTAPVDPVLPAPAGTAQNHLNHQVEKGSPMTVPTTGSCRYCTVPATGPDGLCDFCRQYDGPPITDSALTGPGKTEGHPLPATVSQRLDAAVRGIDALRHDLSGIIAALPGEASMCLALELTAAGTRLRDAAVLIDCVADALDELDEEVAR